MVSTMMYMYVHGYYAKENRPLLDSLAVYCRSAVDESLGSNWLLFIQGVRLQRDLHV